MEADYIRSEQRDPYFAARYFVLSVKLSAFIDDVADAVSRLDSKQLRAATHAKVVVEPSDTYTGDIRQSINRLQNTGIFDSNVSSSLLNRVDSIKPDPRCAAARAEQMTDEPK